MGDERDDAPDGEADGSTPAPPTGGPRYGGTPGAPPTGGPRYGGAPRPIGPAGPDEPPHPADAPRIIPDAPAGFVGTVRPSKSRIPLVLGVIVLIAVVGLGAFLAVRNLNKPGTPWAEVSPRQQGHRLAGMCDGGDGIDGAIPHLPGAELQAGVVINEDQEQTGYFSTFPLDAGAAVEGEPLAHTQVTLVTCARIIADTERVECEVLPGENVRTVIGGTYEIRHIELRTGEVLDREERRIETPGCPDRFVQGITAAIEDQTSVDLLDLVDDTATQAARAVHAG